MFRTFINDAKAAAGATVSKYALRASVAVPFLVAGGFATAAGTLMLVERYGALTAYWVMAAVFAVVGGIAAFLVSAHEHHETQHAAQPEAEPAPTSDAGAQAAAQLPLALLGTLLTTPFGPAAAGTIAKALVRHLPLALLVALIALLIFAPSSPATQVSEPADAEPEQPVEPEAPAPAAQPDREAA